MSEMNNFEIVDLGLPSGTKWAKCNIGATKEEECGKFFQWGSVEGFNDASHSTWATCPFNNGIEEFNDEYFSSISNEVCPDRTLKNEYDAASVLGNEYSMPSDVDFIELYNNTDIEYTETNGISGIKFTSKVDEKQFIFLPSNGIAVDGNIVNVGKCGNYWSKNIMDMNSDLACALNFIGVDVFANGNSSRSYGFGIRPVFKG